jgi:fatty acid desaturase
MAWHLLKPLSGVAYLGALRLYVRPFTAAAPAGAAPGEASATRSRLVELAWIAAMQLGVAWLATGGGRVWVGLLVYPLTAATFGLFFSRVRAFCEHVSETRAPGQCFVRSHMPNALDRLFFYTLNMNLHLEHHLFPQVPACHLWRVRALLAKAGYLEPAMTSTSILRTIVERLGAARRLHESRGSRAPAA